MAAAPGISPHHVEPQTILAARLGETQKVLDLLDNNRGHGDDCTSDGLPLVLLASARGDAKLVKGLLERGVDPNTTGQPGTTWATPRAGVGSSVTGPKPPRSVSMMTNESNQPPSDTFWPRSLPRFSFAGPHSGRPPHLRSGKSRRRIRMCSAPRAMAISRANRGARTRRGDRVTS